LRGELSDARRRVDIANHARKQALIVTALFRAQCEEAAREKRDLLVRRDDARDERATFAPSTKRPLVVRSRDIRALSRSPAAFTAQARLRASSEEITKLKIQLDAQAGLLRLQRALETSSPSPPARSSPSLEPVASSRAAAAATPGSLGVPDRTPPSPEPWWEPPSPMYAADPATLSPPPTTTMRSTRGFAALATAAVSPAVPSDRGAEDAAAAYPAGSVSTPGGTFGFVVASPLSLVRSLRARRATLCYAEPSLKTKMRRPRSPPRPALGRGGRGGRGGRDGRRGVGGGREASPAARSRVVASRRHRRRLRYDAEGEEDEDAEEERSERSVRGGGEDAGGGGDGGEHARSAFVRSDSAAAESRASVSVSVAATPEDADADDGGASGDSSSDGGGAGGGETLFSPRYSRPRRSCSSERVNYRELSVNRKMRRPRGPTSW
jgi:hypothetical protein